MTGGRDEESVSFFYPNACIADQMESTISACPGP